MDVDVEIVRRMPTLEEHRRLFEVQGWPWYGEEVAERSLAGSRFGAVAVLDGETVGMGRVLGDGGMFHYVQDMVVVPELRGRGVGAAVLDALLEQVRSSAPGETIVGLFSTPEGIPFYRGFGFGEPELTGLMHVIRP